MTNRIGIDSNNVFFLVEQSCYTFKNLDKDDDCLSSGLSEPPSEINTPDFDATFFGKIIEDDFSLSKLSLIC
jgi:hypothetical protein